MKNMVELYSLNEQRVGDLPALDEQIRDAYPNINFERIRMWIDALRSGDYTQTSGTLERWTPESPLEIEAGRRGEIKKIVKNCCLGVVCDVAIKNGLKLDTNRKARESDGKITWPEYDYKDLGGLQLVPIDIDFNNCSSYLPYDVAEWLGFTDGKEVDTNPTVAGVRKNPPAETFRARRLSQWNDTFGWTFADIADALERTFLPTDWAARQPETPSAE